MEIIVENRRDPNEFYKFFDVGAIRYTMVCEEKTDGTERWSYGFSIVIKTDCGIVEKKFSEWEYKFYLV